MPLRPKLFGKVSSDASGLGRLQALGYGWLPNERTVRPSEAGKAAKAARLAEILATYVDLTDYLLHAVFGQGVESSPEHANKLRAASVGGAPGEAVFAPNEFPYAIEQGNHYVLWYCVKDKPKSDEEISRDIERELRRLLGCGDASEPFDFAWYENPAMSVPEFYHVQVFWSSD